MSLILRKNKGQKLTINELDSNFEYLESLSSVDPSTPINKVKFTTSESVSSGKVVQVLIDGTVREFKISELTEEGYFIDSLVLPDKRILFLYVTENDNGYYYGGGSTKAKLLTIQNGDLVWSEESVLIEDFPPFNQFGINLIWDTQKELVLVTSSGYLYSPTILVLKITGDVVSIESEVSVNFENINSIIWHPILNRYIIAYYDDELYYGVIKIGIFQLVFSGGEYSLNELDSIIYESYDNYPVELKYESNKVSVVPTYLIK